MHNALTISMQRGLWQFSAGGWEHATANRELEDFRKSLALSCLAARSGALGQHQITLSCPMHQAKSFFLDFSASLGRQDSAIHTSLCIQELCKHQGWSSASAATISFLPNSAGHLSKPPDTELACMCCIFSEEHRFDREEV